jgi:PAS domain S-box-containing protein
MQGVANMEQKTTRQDAERVRDTLSHEFSGLGATAFDWAAWDDTYAFIQSNSTDYIESNLVDETFTTLRLNFMLFINSSGQVIFSRAFDLLDETEIPVPQSLLRHLAANDFLLRHENTTSSITGLILLPEGSLLVASQPILTSNGKGPIRGTLIIGRFLDSAEMNRLTEITQLLVSIQVLDGSPMAPDFQVANSHLSKGESVFVQPLNREIVAGYVLLEDIYENHILILRFDVPRDFYAQGQASFIYIVFALAALGVVFGGVTMLLLEKFVLFHLSRLSTDISKIGKSSDFTARVSVTGKDDLSNLAEEINKMLSALRQAEEKLSALNFYGRSLNMAKNMEEIYRLTLDAMQKVLGFEYADLMMIDKSMLCIVDQRGYPKPFSLELPLDGSKRGITIEVVRTGNSVLAPDVRKNIDFVKGLSGILSELAVPIKIGNRVLGVVNVESKRLDAFDEKDQELLEILASHAATAISNLEYAKNLEAYARQIRESQEKFERLFMDNPEAAVYVDQDFHILDANPRFSELFGYSLGEIKGKCLLDLIVPEDKKEEATMLDKEAKKAYTYYETVRKRKDGTLVPVSISAAPITVKDQPISYVGLYRDITERKRYEERLSALNNYSRILNVAKSMEEIHELTLDAAKKTLGFEFADILMIEEKMLCLVTHRGHSKNLSLKLPLDGDKGITIRTARTGEPILVPDISKEKAYVEGGLETRSELAVPIKIGNRVLGVVNVESKRLDAFDEKDQELLEILASHAATAISNTTKRYEIEKYSSQLAWLMKSSVEMIHSTDLHQRLQSIVEAIRELGWRRAGIRLTDENLNTLSPKDIVLAGFTDEEREFLEKNISPGHVWRERFGPESEQFKLGEFYYFPWSNPLVRKMFTQAVVPSNLPQEELGDWDPRDMLSAPLRLADGHVVGILGIDDPLDGKRPTRESLAPLELFLHQTAVVIENAQLIQQQKEYMEHLEEKVEERTRQLKDAQEKLIKSERLAAIGQVAAMVGHDLRNPLTGIKGATYYLKTKLGPKMDEKAREMLELIDKDVEHSNKIITDLMEYSKEIRLELTETTPKSIVRDALSLVEVPENVQVLDLTQSEPKIKMDVEKMKRVFYNLVKNAVDAMSKGGKLTITSRESDGNVELAFADTGIGMTKEIMGKLCTPFFTTKARGMGLGLAICKRIIEAHGGKISVESTIGKGTTFKVTISIEPKIKEGGEKVWVNALESLLSTTTKA